MDSKKTMDIVLAVLGITVALFTIAMIWVYMVTGGTPDSLVYSFFGAVTGEAGFMGWIKTSKVIHREREWQLEDRELQVESEQKKLDEMKEVLAMQAAVEVHGDDLNE